MSKAISQQIVENYIAGTNVTPLAKEFGVDTSTVRRAIDRAGLNRRPRTLAEDTVDRILDLQAVIRTQAQKRAGRMLSGFGVECGAPQR
jgi:transposase-like protein